MKNEFLRIFWKNVFFTTSLFFELGLSNFQGMLLLRRVFHIYQQNWQFQISNGSFQWLKCWNIRVSDPAIWVTSLRCYHTNMLCRIDLTMTSIHSFVIDIHFGRWVCHAIRILEPYSGYPSDVILTSEP